jgi:hypothetical protein
MRGRRRRRRRRSTSSQPVRPSSERGLQDIIPVYILPTFSPARGGAADYGRQAGDSNRPRLVRSPAQQNLGHAWGVACGLAMDWMRVVVYASNSSSPYSELPAVRAFVLALFRPEYEDRCPAVPSRDARLAGFGPLGIWAVSTSGGRVTTILVAGGERWWLDREREATAVDAGAGSDALGGKEERKTGTEHGAVAAKHRWRCLCNSSNPGYP